MKHLLLTISLFTTTLICFAQTRPCTRCLDIKQDSTHKVVVVTFPDSSSYFRFLEYIGSIPTKSEYNNIYNYFKTLPAEYKLVADKPKHNY